MGTTNIKVAILVDGSFFIKRLQFFKRTYFQSQPDLTSTETIKVLNKITWNHLQNDKHCEYYLYRIFYYDAEPLSIKAHYPIPAPGETKGRGIDFSKDPRTIYRKEILDELKKQRKVALRLGTIKYDKQWKINDKALNSLISGEKQFSELSNEDFYYGIRQKGVDIKLGIDISTISQNRLVDKIILVAGDSDFVPAAKLARTSGLDFVLDPLRNNIEASLYEHIDGLASLDLVKAIKTVIKKEPDIKPPWWK